MLFPPQIFVAWRGRIAAMLALLLTISIVGQQLPCMHATTSNVTTSVGSPSTDTPLVDHEHQSMSHQQHATTQSSENSPENSSEPAPVSHHDPAAPGCAQLMACGLVVQSETTTVAVLSAISVSREAPVGVPLAFTTAELEVESPPPRA